MAETKKAALHPEMEREQRAVPYAPNGEPQNLFVGLNGKTYNVPRGKLVSLPRAVWEILDRMLAAEKKQQDELRRN